MRIPILTFRVASASMRRYFSNRNLSQCQIKWSTSGLQQFEIDQEAIQQINVQIKLLTQCIQTFSPPFDPQIKAEGSPLENRMGKCTSIRRVPFCLSCSHQLWKSLEDNGLSKIEPYNSACLSRLSTSLNSY
jgi:hypothetical protein